MPRPKRTVRRVPKPTNTGPQVIEHTNPDGRVPWPPQYALLPKHPDEDAFNYHNWPEADFAGRPLYAGMPVDQVFYDPYVDGCGNMSPTVPVNDIQYTNAPDFATPRPEWQMFPSPDSGRVYHAGVDYGQKFGQGNAAISRDVGWRPLYPLPTGNMSSARFEQTFTPAEKWYGTLSAARAYNAAARIEDARVRQLDRRRLASLSAMKSLPENLREEVLVSAALGGFPGEKIGLAGRGLQKTVRTCAKAAGKKRSSKKLGESDT